MTKSFCIYSVITNDYDFVPPVVFPNIPHILFTDNPNINAPKWEVVEVDKTEDQRLQRKIKILGHEVLENYQVTVYLDANIVPKNNFAQIIKSFRGGMIIGAHPHRKCVYTEGLAVKRLNKAPEELVNAQIAEYYENNFPDSFGMWSAGVLIRDKSCNEMNRIWYEQLSKHSHRDQLSLPWALWKTELKPKEIPLMHYVTIKKHKKKEPPKVFYSTPFRSDKNIGRANNEFIELLPDDSWVCITDGDALWLRPDWGKCIEEVIKSNGEDYGLIGCMTNRLGGLHQCHNNEFSECMDMSKHYNIANKLWENNTTLVEETTGVAGVCMIFKKETWKRAGGFKENTITADTEFNKSIKKLGLKVGLSRGLYMLHSYRIWEKSHKEAWASVNHLR